MRPVERCKSAGKTVLTDHLSKINQYPTHIGSFSTKTLRNTVRCFHWWRIARLWLFVVCGVVDMNIEASFLLVPSQAGVQKCSGGAVSSDSSGQTSKLQAEISPKQMKSGEGEHAPKSILKTSTQVEGVDLPSQCDTSRTIPGTWHMTLTSQHPTRLTSRTFRATPFEPLAHQRNLPKDGTISPLHIEEYHAYQQDRLQLPTLRVASGDVPPVQEIRIPTPQHHDDSSICSAVGDTASEECFKNLYFSSQRELHAAQDITAKVMEENRLLKRRLIEMQKQLFAVSRNRRTLAPDDMQNTAWSIPTSSAPQCNKRRKTEKSRYLDARIRSSIISDASTVGDQLSPPECAPSITTSVSADAAASSTM